MNKKGVTLLEMVLVLVIIAAIILIAGRYYQQASEASKVSDTTSKVRRIIEASYEWQKVNHTFQNLNNIQQLIDLDLLSTSDIKGPWGGNFEITGPTSSSDINAGEIIAITIPNVPNTACLVLRDNLDRQNVDTSSFSCTTTQSQQAIYPKS